MILEHRKSTVAEGVHRLVALPVGLIGFGLLAFFLFPILKPAFGFLVGFFVILGVVLLGFLVMGLSNLWAKTTFVCALDEHELRCEGAAWGCGENFRVALDDITRLEWHRSPDVDRWYIHDCYGRKFALTQNYENPAARFFELIRKLRPDVEQVVT